MIKAVVFDLDNTLYDYDECDKKAHEALKNYAVKRYNISEEQFEVDYSIAKGIVKERLGNTGAAHNRMLYMQVFLETIGCKPLDGALDLYSIYWDTMLKNMKLFDYVISTMDSLKEKGIKIGILTDLTANIQHRKLCKLNLEGYVDALVTSEEAGEEKPAVAPFECIIKKLECAADEVLMIGDSQKKDIEGAKHVGMRHILFKKEYAENMQKMIIDEVMRIV